MVLPIVVAYGGHRKRRNVATLCYCHDCCSRSFAKGGGWATGVEVELLVKRKRGWVGWSYYRKKERERDRHAWFQRERLDWKRGRR